MSKTFEYSRGARPARPRSEKYAGTVSAAQSSTVVQGPSGSSGSSVTVDAALSATSENPVQNKAVKAALDGLATDVQLALGHDHDIAGMVTTQNITISNLRNEVQDYRVAVEELERSIPAPVTVDAALSATSENPVQNKAVKAALDGMASTLSDASTRLSGCELDIDDLELAVGQLEQASGYSLPPASASTLGGVKVGGGLSAASDGTVSVIVDAALDGHSANPVANSAVLVRFLNLQNQIQSIGQGQQVEVDAALDATSENPVQNKAVKAALDAFGVDAMMRTAPRVRMETRGGLDPAAAYSRIVIDHPLLGLPGYEAVLMVYRRRLGRSKTSTSGGVTRTRTKSDKRWAAALGDRKVTGHSAAFTTATGVVDPESLRGFVMRRFCNVSGWTATEMYQLMTPSVWRMSTTTDSKGFIGGGSRMRLGFAVRRVNPEFEELWDPSHSYGGGGAASSATELMSGTRRVRKYLYTPTTAVHAFLRSDNHTHNRRWMDFGLER